MNDHDLDRFEKELQGLKPSRPPEVFAACLAKTIANSHLHNPNLNPDLNLNPCSLPHSGSPSPGGERRGDGKHKNLSIQNITGLVAQLRVQLRWLIPATALVLASLVLLRSNLLGLRNHNTSGGSVESAAALKADDVKIDSTLVSSFDAVANLPDGEPVRFRCEEWVDEVRLKDSSRGLVYSQKVPRVTVVPVCFETY